MSVTNRVSALFLTSSLLFALAGSGVLSAAQTVQSSSPAQDFGTVSVGTSTPASATLNYTVSGLSGSPKFAVSYGQDFTLGAATCSGSGTLSCSAAVTFLPHSAGLRQDALLVETSAGALLYTSFLHGIGSGAQSSFSPGAISTVAGTPGVWAFGGDGALATAAAFANPENVAVDSLGNIYIADSINQVVRKVTSATHVVTTVAGTPYRPGFTGDGGLATSARLNTPWSVALDGAGNLYIADYGNNRIRMVSSVTGVISTVAGGGTARSGSDGLGDGGLATSALLNGPADVAIDGSGDIYVPDSLNNVVRMVNSATNVISVVAGGGTGSGGTNNLGDGAAATQAILRNPVSVALDTAGNLYIADKSDDIVRMVSASSNLISTVAGNGGWGYYGDNGAAVNANLYGPMAVRLDVAGNLYVADFGNNVVRKVNAATKVITTFAGTPSSGYGGDGGIATAATLNSPGGVAIDASGKVYIADTGNNIVRVVSSVAQETFPTTAVGLISPVQTVSFSNMGNLPMPISSVGLSSGFVQVTSGGVDCAASLTLSPGATCQLAVAAAPSSATSIAGQLVVSSSALSTPAAFLLYGSGTGSTGSQVMLSSASLSFGNQAINSSSAVQVVTVTNKTSGTLSIASLSLSGLNSSDFKVTGTTCSAIVAAGGNCTVSVVFAPTAAGSRAGSLIFTMGAAASTQIVALSGVGIGSPQLSVSASSLVFASQSLAGTPAVQHITLGNTGTAVLNFNTVSITGTNAADFFQSGGCSGGLSAGSSCTLSVWFTPTAAGTRTASLSVASSATNTAQIIGLSGTAIATALSYKFAPANASFESGSLAGWNVVGSASVTTVPHSGLYGLKQQAPSGTTLTYQDVTGLTPGQNYIVSAWVKSASPSTNGATLYLHDTTGGNSTANSLYPNGSWQQISAIFVATSTGALRIHLLEPQSSATLYWDDVGVSLSPANGGFEAGLNSWNMAGTGQLTSAAHSGTYALAQQAPINTTLTYQDVQGLIPGQSYVISAWVRSSNAASNAAEIWLHDTQGNGVTGTVVYPGTGWQQVSALFTATSTAAIRIHLVEFPGVETIYWDDVTISAAVPNGDFETGAISPWNVAGTAAISTTAHTGVSGLTEQAASGNTLTYQDVPGLIPGQNYLISGWVKASASTAGAAEIWVHDTTGINMAGSPSNVTTSWQRINVMFTATNTMAVRVHLFEFSGSETLSWDDITISAQ